MRVRRSAALAFVVAFVMAWVVLRANSIPERAAGTEMGRDVRLAALRAQAPGLSRLEIERRIASSDAIVKQHGQVDLVRMLREVDVSEDDRARFFEENEDVFGGRGYEESWMSVDALVRVQIVRELLDEASTRRDGQ